MKQNFIAIYLFLAAFLLPGCHQAPKPTPLTRVVTQAVICMDGIERSYSTSDSVEAILAYLRLLKPHGTPGNMADSPGSQCDITLVYSDGSRQYFQQRDNRYFLDQDGNWKNIDESKALGLSKLFHLLTPDTESADPPTESTKQGISQIQRSDHYETTAAGYRPDPLHGSAICSGRPFLPEKRLLFTAAD